MAGGVLGEDEDVTSRNVSFDGSSHGKVVHRVVRGSASGQSFSFAHAQRTIYAGFLGATTLIQSIVSSLPVSGHHRPIGLRLQVPRRRLLDQGKNLVALPVCLPRLAP